MEHRRQVTHIGYGVVGGYFFTMDELGRQAGELVKRLLNGENVNEADLPSALPSYFVVDWTQLQRWHLSESRLPPGTVHQISCIEPLAEVQVLHPGRRLGVAFAVASHCHTRSGSPKA